MSRLKVLQIIDTLGMGGAETWLMEVLRFWRSDVTSNPQMDFLVTSGKAGVFDEEARHLGAKIFYVPFQRNHLIKFAREFRGILSEGGYDAIHDHSDYVSGWHFLLGAGYLPRARITHVHNPSYQIKHNYGVTFVRRLTAAMGKKLVARYATHIAGTSRRVLEEYGFYSPGFSSVPKGALHCGFRPERFLGEPAAAKASLCEEFGWPTDSRIICFAGRIDRSADPTDAQAHKNAPFAIEVGIESCRRDSRVRMLLAGELSRAVSTLQRRIDAAGCSGKIVFAGVRRDIEQLMLASDLLLFPSRGEGLGMVAVEAQAAGLPVIASTFVPRECVVIEELVRFVPLSESAVAWSNVALGVLHAPRPKPERFNRAVASSDFATENSARKLLELYSGLTMIDNSPPR
jgi:glycosyltransferase EpsF